MSHQPTARLRPAVVITGASTGIGRACAVALAGHGSTVIACVRRPEDGRRLESEGPDGLRSVLLDVTDRDSIAAAAAVVADTAGDAGLDALVNNAGIVVGCPVEIVPIDALREQLEVNTIGAVAVTQAMLPMLRAARGRIVNISSISGRMVFPCFGPYAASKFALEALSDALRVELRRAGVEVVLVEPGGVSTPIWRKSVAAAEALQARLPEADRARYDETMRAVRFFAEQGEARGMPVEKVVRVVERALAARRPRARYLVGGESRLALTLGRLLPTRMTDALMDRAVRRIAKKGSGVFSSG